MRAYCPDGVVRDAAVGEADSFFSKPATVKLGRVTVIGFVTEGTGPDGGRRVEFHPEAGHKSSDAFDALLVAEALARPVDERCILMQHYLDNGYTLVAPTYREGVVAAVHCDVLRLGSYVVRERLTAGGWAEVYRSGYFNVVWTWLGGEETHGMACTRRWTFLGPVPAICAECGRLRRDKDGVEVHHGDCYSGRQGRRA